MIRRQTYLDIDKNGKELLEPEMQLFNLSANEGDIQNYAMGYIPSHWHKELEIFILLEGNIQIGINDCVYPMQAGEGCFINTEVLHSFTAKVTSPCTFQSFVFSPDIIGGTPGSIFDTAYVRPLLEHGVPFLKFVENEGDEFYFEEFRRAFTACVKEHYGYEFQVRNALSNILLYTKSKSPLNVNGKISSIQEARLKEMLSWIDNHLEQNLSVSEIAATVNICPRECQRIFNQYLHYSPIEYVQRKRIFAAIKQLSDTEQPITDISLNCGFSNPSYFAKQFKAFMGCTPREYRSAIKKQLSNQHLENYQ